MGRRNEPIKHICYVSIKGADPVPTSELTLEQHEEASLAIFDVFMGRQGYERVMENPAT